jgi:hypothetical protein
MVQWLLARRNRSDPTELAYFRAVGPAATALEELVRVAGMRWAIEMSQPHYPHTTSHVHGYAA